MRTHDRKFFRMLAVALLAASVAVPAAYADDDDDEGYGRRGGERYGERHGGKNGGENRGRSMQPVQFNAKFQQECSTCHVAYAPALLPAESWRKVMAGLSKHFGTDASLDDQDNREITAFLVNNASNRWSASTAPLRISESAWFRREHNDREIAPSVWKNPKVKSPANCEACHPRADRGDFNEHDIQIPR